MILSFANIKGGVGKSTLSVHVTAWFHDHGKSLGTKVALVDADKQGSSSEWLRDAYPEIPSYRWTTADEILENVPRLQEAVELVIIDGPAGDGMVTRAMMTLSDGVLLPVGPSVLDLRAATDAMQMIHEAESVRGSKIVVRVIPNKLQKNFRLSKELLETVGQFDVAGSTGVGLRQAFADAVGQGTVVWKMGRAGKMAADEIDQLMKEILADESTFNA